MLSVDDVRAIYRLHRTVHADLARRSAQLFRVADYDRLGRLLDLYLGNVADANHAAALHRAFTVGLLRPSATCPELGTIIFLQRQINKHYIVGMLAHGLRPLDYPHRDEVHSAALAAFRSGDPDRAESAARSMSDWAESLTLWMTEPR